MNTYQISVGIDKLNWPEYQYLRHQRFCGSGWTPSFSSGSPKLARRVAANSGSKATISYTFSVQHAEKHPLQIPNNVNLSFYTPKRVFITAANANANRKQTKTGCCFARCVSTSSESRADWLFPSCHRELGECKGTDRRGGSRGRGVGVNKDQNKVLKPECLLI